MSCVTQARPHDLQSEHFVVEENGHQAVQRSRQQVGELEAREPLEAVFRLLPGHGEDHAVRLPLQAIANAQLREHLVYVRVRTEKDVQPSFDPVTILVLPCGYLASQNISRLMQQIDPKVSHSGWARKKLYRRLDP